MEKEEEMIKMEEEMEEENMRIRSSEMILV